MTAAAIGELGRRIDQLLGNPEAAVESPASPESPLAALGAALVVGDRASTNRHLRSANGAGLSPSQLLDALQMATRAQADAMNNGGGPPARRSPS